MGKLSIEKEAGVTEGGGRQQSVALVQSLKTTEAGNVFKPSVCPSVCLFVAFCPTMIR
jgi:hypothetical protein